MHRWKAATITLVALFPFDLSGCGTSESGTPALASLVRVDTEAPGPNCAAGGVAIRNGTDTDGNGVLSDTEASTHYVCNGAPMAAQAGPETAQRARPTATEDAQETVSGETTDADAASPESAAGPAAESTKAPGPDADFEEVLSAATAAVKDTRFGQGLELCKRALGMQPDDQVAAMTCVIAACNLKDGTAAKTFIRKIKSDVRKAGLRQICLRSGFDLK